jgi:two-component system phosphate regulon sensor histidine kinase PhoR
MRDRIFERFARLDNAAAGQPPGTGVGLYIGRALAERQGGSLTLERSEPGRGSRFVLRLPPARVMMTVAPEPTLPAVAPANGH